MKRIYSHSELTEQVERLQRENRSLKIQLMESKKETRSAEEAGTRNDALLVTVLKQRDDLHECVVRYNH